jgi:hypothetical protein
MQSKGREKDRRIAVTETAHMADSEHQLLARSAPWRKPSRQALRMPPLRQTACVFFLGGPSDHALTERTVSSIIKGAAERRR